jgi:RNA polymerase sigma-70 factor (ECF subfamily)
MIAMAEAARAGAIPFEDFFISEYPTVYRAAFLGSGSRETAQDVTQEAFARAYSRWNRLRRQPWVGGWVMTTALNLCKRHHTQASRTAALVPHEDAEDRLSNDIRLDLATALRRLPHRQRTATVLFYLGDLPVPQIAQLMQISEGTVKAHLAQARSALRDSMGGTHE